jgi:type VI protein secretion system component VasK
MGKISKIAIVVVVALVISVFLVVLSYRGNETAKADDVEARINEIATNAVYGTNVTFNDVLTHASKILQLNETEFEAAIERIDRTWSADIYRTRDNVFFLWTGESRTEPWNYLYYCIP